METRPARSNTVPDFFKFQKKKKAKKAHYDSDSEKKRKKEKGTKKKHRGRAALTKSGAARLEGTVETSKEPTSPGKGDGGKMRGWARKRAQVPLTLGEVAKIYEEEEEREKEKMPKEENKTGLNSSERDVQSDGDLVEAEENGEGGRDSSSSDSSTDESSSEGEDTPDEGSLGSSETAQGEEDEGDAGGAAEGGGDAGVNSDPLGEYAQVSTGDLPIPLPEPTALESPNKPRKVSFVGPAYSPSEDEDDEGSDEEQILQGLRRVSFGLVPGLCNETLEVNEDYKEININELILDKEPIGRYGHNTHTFKFLAKHMIRGAFGTVFKGTWRGAKVAVKRLHVDFMKESDLKQFRHEASLMRYLRSNIET